MTVVSIATGLSRTVAAGTDGEYVVQTLTPGTYRLRAELSGFRPLVGGSIRFATGKTVAVDLQLELSGVTEAVTVVGAAPLLRTETASLGQVIDQGKIVGLPLNGPDVHYAGLPRAGRCLAARVAPAAHQRQPADQRFLFDGISVLQPEPGQVAFFPIVDSIQEFKIESNSPPRGVRPVQRRCGSTSPPGPAATRFTAPASVFPARLTERAQLFPIDQSSQAGVRRNQFGGVFGGPIRRNSTFFFVDYQGQRQTIARTVISTVPTTLQRQGIFTESIAGRVPVIYDPSTTVNNVRTPFPNNTVPEGRWDPVARNLLSRFPVPTGPGTANNFRRTADETVDQDQFTLRGDHHLGARGDAVFARLTRFSEEFIPVTPYPDGSGVAGGVLGPQNTTSWSLATSYRSTYGTSAFNEIRFGDTRRTVGRTAASLAAPPSAEHRPARHPGHRPFSQHAADVHVRRCLRADGLRRPTRRPTSGPASPSLPIRSAGRRVGT